MSTYTTPLTSGWTVTLESGGGPEGLRGTPIPATVPGCSHADLLAAGLIADPYVGRNELEVAWVGRADWRYDTRLPEVTGDWERVDLVFDGLDTVAQVSLDGRVLGETRNMHRSYRFDVTGRAREGAALSVRFTSAYTEAEALRDRLGPRPNAYPEPFNYVRKMAASFGWDWGPTLVTAGIWRPARLECWNTARLAQVRPVVTVTGGRGRVVAHLELERTAPGREVHASVTVGGHTATTTITGDRGAVAVEVPDVALWWPRGHGAQPLYPVRVLLTDAETGAELDVWERRIGFRTVELDQSPDAHGTAFTLRVNGVPVFARGVNWIPDDALPVRVTPERYRARLEQAAAIGVNLVRVWGGGIYEDAAFYTECDELGLMVWQDFLFACAAYPEEQPLRGEVDAEARENVVRLMPHPSLVLWNGNNENLWGFRDWDWEDALAGESWGEGYYLGLLPRIVAELDSTRPYVPGSPWSGSWDRHPNDPAHGPSHFWEVWNRRDYTDYLNEVPRFAAEFGWQAPPAYATLTAALPGEDLSPDSAGMLHHQKAEDGNGKLRRGLAHHFTTPVTFDDWHYLTQVNQARAVATAVAYWRSRWPVCAGTVVWQLNDCWPVTSWAAIDGAGRPKPLYHELRRLYADRLLTFQTHGGVRVLAVDNQSADLWQGVAAVRRMRADGTVLAKQVVPFSAGPRSVAVLPLPEGLAEFGDVLVEFLVADADRLRDVMLGCADAVFGYPPAEFDLDAQPVPGGLDVVITAHNFVRDLLLQADRLSPAAVADTGLVTLLPGETRTIRITGVGAVDVERLRAAIFSVNAAQPTLEGALRT
ncbi:glycoside hydrolase family 2 protein [Acrocarpospora catenulata]|uniref:glycoside hydrolase family 2 protein n=1 Tax=Acrocarpospora catenulata TaxID=2836182 RepID=UPI001BDB517D|nr:glycoside hydrolase family 2 protein [Acrocarpospora catenulata]